MICQVHGVSEMVCDCSQWSISALIALRARGEAPPRIMMGQSIYNGPGLKRVAPPEPAKLLPGENVWDSLDALHKQRTKEGHKP